MPYIAGFNRGPLNPLSAREPQTAGELNYQITVLLHRYWQLNPRNYQTINDIIGAVEGAKAEFQRRVVAPYEDEKITENGDVYASR